MLESRTFLGPSSVDSADGRFGSYEIVGIQDDGHGTGCFEDERDQAHLKGSALPANHYNEEHEKEKK